MIIYLKKLFIFIKSLYNKIFKYIIFNKILYYIIFNKIKNQKNFKM